MHSGGTAYIQARLTASAGDDLNSHGKGVTETSVVLYNIDDHFHRVKSSIHKKAVGEP